MLATTMFAAGALFPPSGSLPLRAHAAARAPSSRLCAEPTDDFDMGLLKMPRLTTPQRASFEAYRERRQKESMKRFEEPSEFKDPKGYTPLGLDPVEGDPVDLKEVWADEAATPTEEQVATAEAEFNSMMRGEAPPAFGDGIDGLDFGP